jgi:DNA-binding transcriptional MocR family regulator
VVLIQYLKDTRTASLIAEGVESAVREGVLSDGDVLPSVRNLANDIGLAAGTVAAAYRTLRERGLVETRGRRGTVVRGPRSHALRSGAPLVGSGVLDLSTGQPDPSLLPALGDLTAALAQSSLSAPAQSVLPGLRATAQQRLVADAVPADFVTVANGGLDAIGRVLAARLRRGDLVAIEDPGWPNLLDHVATLGMRAYPVPVDEHGPLPNGFETALQAGARAVVVTNRAQNPTGAYVNAARAAELRRVLQRHPQTVTIEDDHAAELTTAPLATLAGTTDAWAFVRSMSKPYGPDLRLAVLAGDPVTIDRVEAQIRVTCGWVSTVLQRLAAHMHTDARVEKAISHAADEYERRRRLLIDRLDELAIPAFGATGLNVWVPVPDETAATTALLQAGWVVAPGKRFRQQSSPGIRITMATSDDAQIGQLAAEIHRSLAPSRAHTHTT